MYRIQDFFLFHGRTIAVGLLGLVVTAALLIGGLRLLENPELPFVDDEPAASACTVLAIDVGDSTGVAGATKIRQQYSDIAQGVIDRAADADGTVITGYFAGNAAETSRRVWSFDPDTSNSFLREQRRNAIRAEFQQTLKTNLTARQVATNGSAILATIKKLSATSPAGCAITVATDGIENSALAAFGTGGRTQLVTDGAIDRLIASLAADGMIPDLSGREFAMPAIGEVADGLRGNAGTVGREIDPRRREMVAEFWRQYAIAAGTTLNDRIA